MAKAECETIEKCEVENSTVDTIEATGEFVHPQDSTQIKATLLRGLPVSRLLRRFGKLMNSNVGGQNTFDMSKYVERIGYFVSHSWRTKGWLKTIALMYKFNVKKAIAVSLITHIFICAVCLVAGPDSFPIKGVAPGYMFDGTAIRVIPWEWHYVPACVVFLVVYVWGAEVSIPGLDSLCFLDKCCISQTDETLKLESIKQLGGFLRNSDRMLVLWNEECIYIYIYIHIYL